MINLQRLKMAIEGIDLVDDKLEIYLKENELESYTEYNAGSNSNKKMIVKTALSILEDIANNPQLMREYKTDDMTISQFSENIRIRIDNLEKKIRLMADDNQVYQDGASFCYMFSQ